MRDPTSHEWTKRAGIAGACGVVLASVGAIITEFWDFPGTNATAAEITSHADEHRSLLLVSMLLYTAAVTLWLVFGAGLWLRLRAATGGAETFLSACFVLGLVVFIGLLFAGFLPTFVLAYRTPNMPDARLLYDLSFGLLALSGAPTAVALGAYAALALKTRTLPRWTAELAVLGAVAHVVLLFSLVITEGFFSLQGGVIVAVPGTLFAWIFGTGIALARDRGPQPV
jgi:hypothetical protein